MISDASPGLGLFEADQPPEQLSLANADLRFTPCFYPPAVAAELMQSLLTEIPWRQETLRIRGIECLQPRLSSWHGDPGTSYGYSGILLAPQAWTVTLERLRDEIAEAAGVGFNSVLANLYRDGNDAMGWHSDDEAALGPAPVIASLSLGQTRIFRLRHKHDRTQKPVRLDLSDGSLLIMAGTTQRYWQHAIDRQRGLTGARINLTFRQVSRHG